MTTQLQKNNQGTPEEKNYILQFKFFLAKKIKKLQLH